MFLRKIWKNLIYKILMKEKSMEVFNKIKVIKEKLIEICLNLQNLVKMLNKLSKRRIRFKLMIRKIF